MNRAKEAMRMEGIAGPFWERRAADPKRYGTGERRTRLCEEALKILKRQRKIAGYVSTGFRSGGRGRRGIAFYVAVVRDSCYVAVPLGVARSVSLEESRKKHPKLRFVDIALDEKPERLAARIWNILYI